MPLYWSTWLGKDFALFKFIFIFVLSVFVTFFCARLYHRLHHLLVGDVLNVD